MTIQKMNIFLLSTPFKVLNENRFVPIKNERDNDLFYIDTELRVGVITRCKKDKITSILDQRLIF